MVYRPSEPLAEAPPVEEPPVEEVEPRELAALTFARRAPRAAAAIRSCSAARRTATSARRPERLAPARRDPARGRPLQIVDLGSTNGIEVDGKRVKELASATATSFTLGSTEVVLLSGGATDHVPLASVGVETTLLVLKIAFLVLLYLFIWRIVRSAARDLRLPQESMILSPAAGLGAPRAADRARARPARRRRQPGARGGRRLRDRLDRADGRPQRRQRPAARGRRVRLGPPRALRAAPRRRLRRGHRLDERHVRQRDPARRSDRRLVPGDVVRIGETDLRFER